VLAFSPGPIGFAPVRELEPAGGRLGERRRVTSRPTSHAGGRPCPQLNHSSEKKPSMITALANVRAESTPSRI
jgi:hypothetical protein